MNDFKTDVIHAFQALRSYGFACTQSSDSLITLESDRVVMEVRYDHRRSYEVSVEVRLKQEGYDHLSFGLRDIHREADVPDAKTRRFCQTTNYARAIEFLQETAGLLCDYAKSVLDGKQEAFQRLREDQSKAAAEYTQSINLSADRSSAEKAWQDKKFGEYARLMLPHQGQLSASDQKKLDYAQTQVAKSAH